MTAVVQRILAPVDLAETQEPELDYAIGLAAQLRAELLLRLKGNSSESGFSFSWAHLPLGGSCDLPVTFL